MRRSPDDPAAQVDELSQENAELRPGDSTEIEDELEFWPVDSEFHCIVPLTELQYRLRGGAAR